MSVRFDNSFFCRYELSENGIPVYIQKPSIITDSACLVAVVAQYCGSCADPPGQYGTAHFTEHLLLKATKHFRDELQIEVPFLRHSGSINAYTRQDRMVVFFEIPSDVIFPSLRILADCIQRPLFRERDILIEQKVISQEYRMLETDTEEMRERFLLNCFYGSHPYNHPPIGDLASITRMEKQTLNKFFEKNFHAGNIKILCLGELPPDDALLSELEKFFGDIPKKPANRLAEIAYPYGQTHRVRSEKFSRDSVILSYPYPRQHPREFYTFSILKHCISTGFDAPLVRELRIRRGLVYETDTLCVNVCEANHQGISFVLPVRRNMFSIAEQTVMRTLARLTQKRFTEVKKRVLQSQKMRFERPVDVHEKAVNDIVLDGHIQAVTQEEELLRSVRWKDVDSLRKKILETQPFRFYALRA